MVSLSSLGLAPMIGSFRGTRLVANPDGSITTHLSVKCTLADISRATSMRVEDIGFALKEAGLLERRHKKRENRKSGGHGGDERDGEEDEPDMFVLSREMVEKVAKERHVKTYMRPESVLV